MPARLVRWRIHDFYTHLKELGIRQIVPGAREEVFNTFTSSAAYNEARWKNPKFDALLDQARSEMDATKRNDLYKQAEQLLADDGGIIIPFFLTNVAVIRAECSGYEPNPQSVNLNYDDLTCKGKEAQP